MEYKKSYRGFVIWMIAFCAAIFGAAYLSMPDIHFTVALLGNIMTISIFLLAFIIYKTDSVYWYTGIEFEEARDAGRERRDKFALAHTKRFGYLAAAYLIYSIVSLLLNIPYGFDITLVLIVIVAAAISTINIKL